MLLHCCNRNRKVRQLVATININRNNSLLIQAALWDNVDLLVDLLQEDHDINCVDSWGRGPIHAAAVSSNSKCLQVLINAGADINRQCGDRGDQKTALHLCAELGYLANVKTLLDAQASFVVRDFNGLYALDLASRNGHDDCVGAIQTAIGEYTIIIYYYNIACDIRNKMAGKLFSIKRKIEREKAFPLSIFFMFTNKEISTCNIR